MTLPLSWETVAGIVVVAALSFLASQYWWARTERRDKAALLASDHAKLIARVADLENKLSVVSTMVVPISTAFQAILIKELTHFHTPVLDALLVKLGPPYALTEEEEAEMLEALKQREADMGTLISDEERDAAHILPVIMKRAKAEAALSLARPPRLVEFRLISVPLTAEETEP